MPVVSNAKAGHSRPAGKWRCAPCGCLQQDDRKRGHHSGRPGVTLSRSAFGFSASCLGQRSADQGLQVNTSPIVLLHRVLGFVCATLCLMGSSCKAVADARAVLLGQDGQGLCVCCMVKTTQHRTKWILCLARREGDRKWRVTIADETNPYWPQGLSPTSYWSRGGGWAIASLSAAAAQVSSGGACATAARKADPQVHRWHLCHSRVSEIDRWPCGQHRTWLKLAPAMELRSGSDGLASMMLRSGTSTHTMVVCVTCRRERSSLRLPREQQTASSSCCLQIRCAVPPVLDCLAPEKLSFNSQMQTARVHPSVIPPPRPPPPLSPPPPPPPPLFPLAAP